MINYLGKKIGELRERLSLTQDQFGAKYSVSGPAIFKFEKSYVKPSLDLWLRIAADCGLSERHAVLLWCKAKLPEQFQDFIEIENGGALSIAERSEKYGLKSDVPEYTQITDRKVLRQVVTQDTDIPQGFRDLLLDDDFWIVFKPSGAEIYGVVQKFGMFRNASAALFSEGIRLIRNFFKDDI